MKRVLASPCLPRVFLIAICFPSDNAQAFTEMQINKLETTKKINMIDMKCDMVKTGKHKYQLTEKGTSSLSDDTR